MGIQVEVPEAMAAPLFVAPPPPSAEPENVEEESPVEPAPTDAPIYKPGASFQESAEAMYRYVAAHREASRREDEREREAAFEAAAGSRVPEPVIESRATWKVATLSQGPLRLAGRVFSRHNAAFALARVDQLRSQLVHLAHMATTRMARTRTLVGGLSVDGSSVSGSKEGEELELIRVMVYGLLVLVPIICLAACGQSFKQSHDFNTGELMPILTHAHTIHEHTPSSCTPQQNMYCSENGPRFPFERPAERDGIVRDACMPEREGTHFL